eukprot:CAMPEP_0203668514 /NCGR_PEP_ID=MMETSP0090-20130426/5121_1 /ASSEMBLY_ACC=CAM_ASM_001088 /TAXON_ID=426623 /ORGANISM="Chaetoceros affinis, Strain CCMP159" /LENGTH=377 /DNA_ID=CAMNT_0050532973 /DNA_START=26 /DNA_END=1159 /DNA_ORIENTATION=+
MNMPRSKITRRGGKDTSNSLNSDVVTTKVAGKLSALDQQCSPHPRYRPRASVLKFLSRKRGDNKAPPSSVLTKREKNKSFLSPSKYGSGDELHELRAKVELLHSFLPQEIIETIYHNWSHIPTDKNDNMHGGYNSVGSWTACSSLSSSQHSIPQSIFISAQEESENVETVNPNGEAEDVAIINFDFKHVDEQRANSATTASSKALYSEEANDVCIVFVNIVDFAKISSEISPFEVLDMLQNLFHRFDIICDKYNVLKLDTIGDAYLFCSGCFEELDSDHHVNNEGGGPSCYALRVLKAAKEMVREAQNVPVPNSSPSSPQEFLSIRIGIHIGDASFGVLGQTLPKLVCVGSAVNMAARMEQTSSNNMIHVTRDFLIH